MELNDLHTPDHELLEVGDKDHLRTVCIDCARLTAELKESKAREDEIPF